MKSREITDKSNRNIKIRIIERNEKDLFKKLRLYARIIILIQN
jgi:hypothetical protein